MVSELLMIDVVNLELMPVLVAVLTIIIELAFVCVLIVSSITIISIVRKRIEISSRFPSIPISEIRLRTLYLL